MCENFMALVSTCSNESKQKLSSFLHSLFSNETSDEGEVSSKLEAIFTPITQHLSLNKIRQISKSERCKKDLTNYQFNYGEITFKTIYKIINKIKKYRRLTQRQIFYDLGSGSGKVLFAASLCHPFYKCKGIQFLQSLFQTSVQLKQKIEEQTEIIENEVNEIIKQNYTLPIFQIYNQNFETYDWSDGTIIFVSSTCYTREVMNKISRLCDSLRPQTILITLTRPIQTNNSGWRMKQKFEGETSWGACTVFIHIRDQ